jgi:hypothetical protein
MVGAWQSSPGGRLTFSVNAILPPPNDDFGNATRITSLPYTNVVNTTLATTSVDDPTACSEAGATVWYSFTPAEDLFIDVNTAASDYFTVLGVYTGARGALQLFYCNGGNDSKFAIFAGTTYFFMVGANFPANPPGGHLVFTVTGRPALKIGVSVDTVGSVDTKTGVATIQGTVNSSRPVTIFVSGVLRQKVGRLHIINGEFGNPPSVISQGSPVLVFCTGQCPWSVRIVSADGAFGGGYAFVSISGFASDRDEFAGSQLSETVHLDGSARLKLDPLQPQLVSVQTSPSGTVSIQSLSVMGQTNILQASSNLRDWIPLTTTVPMSNPFTWLDVDGLNLSQRFYRILTLP